MREPTVAWWPGRIPAGYQCDELLTAMDLMPTFARLAGAQVPTDRVIDGKDIWPVLSREPGATSPHEAFFYHQGNHLRAVRSGTWKFFPPGRNPRNRGNSNAPSGAELYDLRSDVGEKVNVAADHPDVAARLLNLFEAFEEELGAGDALSENCRGAGYVEDPKPLR